MMAMDHTLGLPRSRAVGTVGIGLFVGLFVVLIGCASTGTAEAPGARDVASDLEASFQYPPPPTEGEARYFPVAEQGQPRCVVIISATASHAVRKAAGALRDYRVPVGTSWESMVRRRAFNSGKAGSN